MVGRDVYLEDKTSDILQRKRGFGIINPTLYVPELILNVSQRFQKPSQALALATLTTPILPLLPLSRFYKPYPA